MPFRNMYIYAGHQVPHGYVVPMEEGKEEEEEEKYIAVKTSIFKNPWQFDFCAGEVTGIHENSGECSVTDTSQREKDGEYDRRQKADRTTEDRRLTVGQNTEG
jgi:hypothetical protein